jgi:hypothetical protein
MSLSPPAVQLGAADPLAAVSCAHDQAQAQMPPEMHAEQGIQQASLNLESPQERSHAQSPASDLGAGSAPPHKALRDVVDTQSPAAACGTGDAQDLTAIPMSAPPTMNGGDDPNQGKTIQLLSALLGCILVASVVQEVEALILCQSHTSTCSRGCRSRTTTAS